MNSVPTHWQAWIFDLDDTLLDTSGLLIPEATRRALDYLVKHKLFESIEQSLEAWSRWRFQKTGLSLFRAIVEDAKAADAEAFSEQAYRIFRTPLLPDVLEPRESGHQLLTRASQHWPLFLVTQGDIETQMAKVDRLGIIAYFKHVYYIDPFANESKLKAFSSILNHFGFKPEQVLSIGNRLDNEIAFSKRLNMKTCYVRHGEHRFETPSTTEQIPDFEITHLHELESFLPKQGS